MRIFKRKLPKSQNDRHSRKALKVWAIIAAGVIGLCAAGYALRDKLFGNNGGGNYNPTLAVTSTLTPGVTTETSLETTTVITPSPTPYPSLSPTPIPSPSPIPSPTPVPQLWPDELSDSKVFSGSRNATGELKIVEDGEYLYYISQGFNAPKGYYSPGKNLWKMNKDGSDHISLIDASYISKQTSLANKKYISGNLGKIMKINDGRIYLDIYVEISSSGENKYVEKLFSVNMQGKDYKFEDEIETDTSAEGQNVGEEPVSDGTYTYSCGANGFGLYRAKSEDVEKKLIYDGRIGFLNYQDGWLFFVEYPSDTTIPGIVCCMNLETKQRSVILEFVRTPNSSIHELNVCGNWVYFINGEFQLCRIRTNGEEQSVISNKPVAAFVVYGIKIFYYACEIKEKTSNSITYSTLPFVRMVDSDGKNDKAIDILKKY